MSQKIEKICDVCGAIRTADSGIWWGAELKFQEWQVGQSDIMLARQKLDVCSKCCKKLREVLNLGDFSGGEAGDIMHSTGPDWFGT